MSFEPLSEREGEIADKIVDAACVVHKALGPGFLEKVYEVCFCRDLARRGLSYRRQDDVPIVCDGSTFDEGLRLDILEDIRLVLVSLCLGGKKKSNAIELK